MPRAFVPLLAALSAFAGAQTTHRAVLIDGFGKDDGAWGPLTRPQVRSVATILKSRGYAVTELAAPFAGFPALRAALNGADLVVYWGHGVILNSPTCSNRESADVGGFALDGEIVEPERLRREIRLAPGATVLLPNCCYAAGNAEDDDGKVRREVLEARMRHYAEPFLDMGADVVGSCLDAKTFLRAILAGKSVEGAYAASAFGERTVLRSAAGCDFRYRESNDPSGLSTTSALFHRARP